MQRPKGTKDVFGFTKYKYRQIELKFRQIVENYNFDEIETPIFESKDVFIHTIGTETDIVSKEMYEFHDRKNRSLVLRPEGTSGVMRAIAENKMTDSREELKLFYSGPVFRYENPQKGRQRQHTQLGVEFLSHKNPYYDFEVILMGCEILNHFEINFKLKVNSLGTLNVRQKYTEKLRTYFLKNENFLSLQSKQRINKNPLRILDDKIDAVKDVVKNAPKINDFYDSESKIYLDKLISLLDDFGINYEIDHSLVRGLDYYSDTIFEFVDIETNLTLIGGGRYQNLLNKFQPKDIGGVGFGLGLERFAEAINTFNAIKSKELDFYVINMDHENEGQDQIFEIVQNLRRYWSVEYSITPIKISRGFKIAEKLNAKKIIFIGINELRENKVAIKYGNHNILVKIDNLVEEMKRLENENN